MLPARQRFVSQPGRPAGGFPAFLVGRGQGDDAVVDVLRPDFDPQRNAAFPVAELKPGVTSASSSLTRWASLSSTGLPHHFGALVVVAVIGTTTIWIGPGVREDQPRSSPWVMMIV